MRSSPFSLFPSSFLKSIALLAAASSLALASVQASESRKEMLREAKVDRTHAEIIALGRVHGGKVKGSKIERANGHLVWVFDVIGSGERAPSRILVDAETGKIISAKPKR